MANKRTIEIDDKQWEELSRVASFLGVKHRTQVIDLLARHILPRITTHVSVFDVADKVGDLCKARQRKDANKAAKTKQGETAAVSGVEAVNS